MSAPTPMPATTDLDGKRALVTGGSRGIGRAIVLALAAAGADVVTCYRQPSEAVERLVDDLAATGGGHRVVQADMEDPAAADALLAECESAFGALDVVVTNAGTISHVPFADLSLAEYRRVLDTNARGAFAVARAAVPLLAERSSVVMIGSRVALVGIPLRAHYTASKAALVGLMRSLAKELGPLGARVNVVAPGVVATEVVESMSAEEIAQYERRYKGRIALGRFGTPAEIADAVLFLASDRSSYLTGEVLHVDGGI